MRDYGNTTDYRVSGIWGAQTENSGVVVSFEHFNRAPFTWETYEIIRDRPGIDGAFRLAGWPARYSHSQPQRRRRASAGAAGATTIADPLCAALRAFGQHHGQSGHPPGRHVIPRNCQQNAPLGTSANADEDRYQGFIEVHHEINESLKFFGEAGFLRTRTAIIDTPGGAANPGPGQPRRDHSRLCAVEHLPRARTPPACRCTRRAAACSSASTRTAMASTISCPRALRTAQVIVVGTDPNALGANGLPVVPFWEDVHAWSRQPHLRHDLQPARQSRHHRTTAAATSNPHPLRGGCAALRRRLRGQASSAATPGTTTPATCYAINGEDDTTFGSAFSMPNLRAGPCRLRRLRLPDAIQRSAAVRDHPPGQPATADFFNIFGTSVTTTPGSLLANTHRHGHLHHRAGLAALRDQGAGDRLRRLRRAVQTCRPARVGVAIGGAASQGRLVGRLSGAAERGPERPAGARSTTRT